MISYIIPIRKQRLEVIISAVDDDGEFLRSTRRPQLRLYGCLTNNLQVPAPQSIQDSFSLTTDTNNPGVFNVISTVELFRPSFVWGANDYEMSFNFSQFQTNISTIANLEHLVSNTNNPTNKAVILFARITNAKRTPEEIIHLDVGTYDSRCAIKLSEVEVEHQQEIVIVNHMIVEP